MKHIEAVKKLRAMIAQKQNPVCKCPGVYCWWFKQCAAFELLKAFPEFDRDKLQSRQIDGETYLALYFGISKNLKERIEWHVSQHHSLSAVKSGYLSTLRQTLSAVLHKDMSISKQSVNRLMDDNCYWEWECTDSENDAKEREKAELTQSIYCYPLNIQGNKTISKECLKALKELRKIHNK